MQWHDCMRGGLTHTHGSLDSIYSRTTFSHERLHATNGIDNGSNTVQKTHVNHNQAAHACLRGFNMRVLQLLSLQS